MPRSTPATQVLRKLGIAFKLHTYVYDSTVPAGGIRCKIPVRKATNPDWLYGYDAWQVAR